MKQSIMIILFVFALNCSYAQYGNFFSSVIKRTEIFKPVKGKFVYNESRMINIDGKTRKANYSYLFNDKTIKIEFFYPKSSQDSSCSYFEIDGKRISLKSKFEADFACDLDVSSFSIYKGIFADRIYLLLTCTNTGSGSSTTSVICNLFDITDKKLIRYYPLWSKYGGTSCFGDFNDDGLLDFLKVRNLKGEKDVLKAELTSLQKETFAPFENNKHFLILKLDNDSIKVIKRSWL